VGGHGLTYPLQIKYSLHMFDPFNKSTALWTMQAYSPGEAIKLKDLVTITLDRIAVSNGGDELRADFTVMNQSAAQYYFDGAFQIVAPEGPGVQAPSLDTNSYGSALIGMIQPGKKVAGNVCWSGLLRSAITFPLQIKYGYASETQELILWVVNQ
jgi:hypothetical protein